MVEDLFPQAVRVAMKLLRTPTTPDQRASGEARRAYHPPSGYKEITETIGNTHKVTSSLAGEDVPSGTCMTRRCESRKEATMPTPSLLPRQPHCQDTWNVRTMYKAGKSAKVAAEVTACNLSILGFCETR